MVFLFALYRLGQIVTMAVAVMASAIVLTFMVTATWLVSKPQHLMTDAEKIDLAKARFRLS